MEKLEFSLKLKERPVTITDVDGVKKNYVLKELTGPQRDIYMESYDISMTLVDGKPQIGASSIKTFPPSDFVAMCLYDETGVLVKKEVLSTYPGSVISGLHRAGLSLSGLDREGQEEAKNV